MPTSPVTLNSYCLVPLLRPAGALTCRTVLKAPLSIPLATTSLLTYSANLVSSAAQAVKQARIGARSAGATSVVLSHDKFTSHLCIFRSYQRIVPAMTALIPNLADLLAALPSDAAGRDAAELITVGGAATMPADVDAALDQVISRWATP